jgi:hypothetical protein
MLDNILDALIRVLASVISMRQDEVQAIPDQKKQACYEMFRSQLQLVCELICNVFYPLKPARKERDVPKKLQKRRLT